MKDLTTKTFYMLRKITFALTLSICIMGLYAQSLKADEPAKSADETPAGKTWLEDLMTRDKLTGDWMGLRKGLTKHGIDFDLRLSQFYQSVTNGGISTGDEYGGKIDYRLNVDANKLGLWKGLSANVHVETRYGYDILADAGGLTLPNTPMLYPLPGKYHDTDVTGALIMQYLFDGRAALFGGKLQTVDLVTALFPHVGYGQEGFWNVSSLVSALPWFRFVNLSMWGGGGWTIKDGQIQGGAFAYGQKNVSTDTSTTSESFSDGVGFAGFWRFFYKIGDKPGSATFFAGGSTKGYRSLDPTSWSFIPGEGLSSDNKKKPWDVALYLQQVFWQAKNDDKRNAQIFTGGTWGNDDPNFSHWNIFANIEAFGPMASRPNDRMGIAGYFNGITTDFKHLTDDVGIGVRDLWGFEAYYNFKITPWMHLTGDIQLIENGMSGDSTAVIPGIRLVVDF